MVVSCKNNATPWTLNDKCLKLYRFQRKVGQMPLLKPESHLCSSLMNGWFRSRVWLLRHCQ